jgi:hypothetical protein
MKAEIPENTGNNALKNLPKGIIPANKDLGELLGA